MRSKRFGALILGAAMLVTSLGIAQAASRTADQHKLSKHAFHDQMRRQWENHVAWTRLYIVSAAHSLPDQQATAKRLLANQTAIGNAVKPFYGDAAGDKLTSLLRDHILTAAAMIEDAKSGDTAKFDSDKAHWYANGNAIAKFLHTANPDNWPLGEMRHMMKMHLDLTLTEAVDRLQGHYAKDIRDYRPIETEILKMADMLSAGIIAQFPDRF
jgi:hypothetical protein